MADVEPIAPTVPPLPAPVGRRIGPGRKRPTRQTPPRREPDPGDPKAPTDQPNPPHIDEYV